MPAESVNKGVNTPGKYRNERNALAHSGETRGEEAGSKTGQQIAYTTNPPRDPHEDRVEKR